MSNLPQRDKLRARHEWLRPQPGITRAYMDFDLLSPTEAADDPRTIETLFQRRGAAAEIAVSDYLHRVLALSGGDADNAAERIVEEVFDALIPLGAVAGADDE